MPTTYTLPIASKLEKFSLASSISLNKIFRSPVTRLVFEVLTIISLFVAATIWTLAISTLPTLPLL